MTEMRRPDRGGDSAWTLQLGAELKPLELTVPQQAKIEGELRNLGITSMKAQEMIRDISQMCGGIGVQPKMVMSEVLAGLPIKHGAKVAAVESVSAVLSEAMQAKPAAVAPILTQTQPASSPPKNGG